MIVLCFGLAGIGCGQGVFSSPPNTSTPRMPPVDLGAQIYDRDLGDLSFYIDQSVPPDDLSSRDLSLERDEGVPEDFKRNGEDLRKSTRDLDTNPNH